MLFFSLNRVLCLISTISDICKPQHAPIIKSCNFCCQASILLFPLPQAVKMVVSKVIHYFSIHPAAFDFWALSQPDNITLNPTKKKETNQSLSEFQTGIGTFANATLDTKEVMSHTRDAHVGTVASLQDPDEGVISVSEVHQLLTKIHDILCMLCLNELVI